jgi:type II secretory pathway component GspD/PulD (secretin)
MVTIEVRFLTVNRNFIETVGLNLSAQFNTNPGTNPVFSSIPVNISNNGFTSGTSGITTGVPGSIGSGATPSSVAFTYLDDFQVNVMLQAVEAAANSSIVNAPRLSVYDGIQAELAVGTQFDYVSNLTPVVGSGGSVGYTATTSTGSSGISLSVTPIVSADRKYVTLTITTTLALPPVLTPFNLTTPASQSTSVSGTSTVITNGGAGNAVTETIELISQPTTSVETQVAVPDGGTLLLGGQTIAGEAEREQGVPVLSKIPFLKRLFTNTASAKDEQILLILVKPTILIQREQEDKFFPLLSNRASGG